MNIHVVSVVRLEQLTYISSHSYNPFPKLIVLYVGARLIKTQKYMKGFQSVLQVVSVSFTADSNLYNFSIGTLVSLSNQECRHFKR